MGNQNQLARMLENLISTKYFPSIWRNRIKNKYITLMIDSSNHHTQFMGKGIFNNDKFNTNQNKAKPKKKNWHQINDNLISNSNLE